MIEELFIWVAKKLGERSLQTVTTVLSNKVNVFAFNTAAKKYKENIKLQYGQIKLYNLSRPIDIENIYIRVNVIEPRLYRNISIAQIESMYLGKKPSRIFSEEEKDSLEVVKENSKLFVLGKPGAGKTTLLKNIALKAAKGELDLVPIFVSLRNYSESGLSLIDFIEGQFDICNFPDASIFIDTMLSQGKSIIFFDGLDEVTTRELRRDKVTQDLVDFSNKYNKNKILITCRIATTNFDFEHFTYIEISDFNERQINQFIINWFDDERDVKLFNSEFEKNCNLKDLSKNPLLLTLLCIAFSDRWTFSENNRSEIYELAIDALLKKWDSSRKIRRDIGEKITLRQTRQLFQEIAEKSFRNEKHIFKRKEISEEIVAYLKKIRSFENLDLLEGEEILHEIISWTGIFSIRSADLYSFSHLSFQEYFMAGFITDSTDTSNLLMNLFKNHLFDPRWKEIFLLISEMLRDGEQFFTLFLEQIALVYIDIPELEEIIQFTTQTTQLSYNNCNMAERYGHKWIFLSTMLSGIAFLNDTYNSHSETGVHNELRRKLFSMNISIVDFFGEDEILKTVNMESPNILLVLKIQFLAWVHNCLSQNLPLPYPARHAFELAREQTDYENIRKILYKIEKYRFKKGDHQYKSTTKIKLTSIIDLWLNKNCNFGLISQPINRNILNYIYSIDLFFHCLGRSILNDREQYLIKLFQPLD
jgi:hypothetical protein